MGNAPKISSGVHVIDEAWAGLYRGGSYLVYGRAAAGRGLLTMKFAETGAMLQERCLFISPDRPKDLTNQAASMGFNLRQACDTDLVKLMRIPPMLNIREIGDGGVSRALDDLVSVIRQNRPERLVINDFMPFVQFRSFDVFHAAFVQMLEDIDALDATMMIVMAEPANTQSRNVIDFMRNQMTAAVHIELVEEDTRSTQRRLTLLPNIGHIDRDVVETWDLQDVLVEAHDRIFAPRGMLADASVHPQESDTRKHRRFRFAEESHNNGHSSAPEWASEPVAAPPPPQMRERGDQPIITPYRLGRRHPNPKTEERASSFQPIPLGDRPGPHLEETPVPAVPRRTYPERSVPSRDIPERSVPSRDIPERSVPSRAYPERSAPSRDIPERSVPSRAYPAPSASAAPRAEEPFRPAYESEVSTSPTQERASHTDREAFRTRLQQQFLRRNVNETPFLLIAMRMDRSQERSARPFDFEFILDLVSEMLPDPDDLFVELESERLIVLLTDSGPEAAQRFFAQLKNRLREEAPQQADHLLHSVSAIVVPDGRPFQNAEEFLTYSLDEV